MVCENTFTGTVSFLSETTAMRDEGMGYFPDDEMG